jgi:NAD(P)-dependent dehydrogenase (short-subunit alcohol dehydrogenase family)
MSVKSLLDLHGKVAVVTGGSRGIGLQMAEALGEMGARVAITARKQDELDEARAHLEGIGIECLTIPGDLANSATIPAMVDTVLRPWGQIDILVNNAGCNWAAPAEDYPDDGWRKVMSLNIDAQFFLSREVGRRSMIPRKSGKIVNIASIAGLFGNPPEWVMETIAYNTSKGALVQLTRALAAEWGKYNINVNAICPGFFPSKMTKVTLDRITASVLALTPLRRLGGDEDLKGSVVYLASEASRHVTGQVIAVDGGCTVI